MMLWLMSQDDMTAELFVRGFGICQGTDFSGEILGSRHAYSYLGRQVRVTLPKAEFLEGDPDPIGKSASIVHFRSGYVGQNHEKSFYQLDRIYVEVDVEELVRIPKSALEIDAVRKSPDLILRYPHLETISDYYDEVAASAWLHWMRVARWAINSPLIGVPDWSTNGHAQLQMPRLREKSTGVSVWASTGVINLQRPIEIDKKRWRHIEEVLAGGATPPVWFDYLVEAQQRLYNKDFSGCVLSSAIACETLARACYFYLLGTPKHTTAAEMVDRTAAQAIIGRWKKLTGIEPGGNVHKIFDTRNRLVHSGSADVIDDSIARETLKAASTFVDGGDIWWFNQKQLTNPRAEAAVWPSASDSAKPTPRD